MNNRKHELFNVSFGVWPMYLAPFILVFFASINLERYMDVFSPVNWLIAGIMEILGLQAVYTWIRLKTWNDEGHSPPAPAWLAAMAGLVYFITSGVIVVVVQVRPDWAVYAKALFVLIVFSSSLNGSLSKQQDRRERSIEAEHRAERDNERWRYELDAQTKLEQQKLRQSFRLEKLRLQSVDAPVPADMPPDGDLNARIRTELARDGALSIRELARRVGAAPSTVHTRLKRMIERGDIETDRTDTTSARLEVVK